MPIIKEVGCVCIHLYVKPFTNKIIYKYVIYDTYNFVPWVYKS